MNRLMESARRHEIVTFIILTYAFSWGLWKAFDRLYLDGRVIALPFLMAGIFGPGFVSIALSALLDRGPRQPFRAAAMIAFAATWLPATLIISLDQMLNEGRSATFLTVVMSGAAALMPAVVVSSAFSGVPGIRRHLASLVRPKGSAAYYLLALVLFTAIWSLGIPITRALGLPVPQRAYPPAASDAGLLGAIALTFFYNFIPNGLSEEIGWRGFALPRLQGCKSPLVASLILWIVWAVWHAPAYLGGFAAQSPVDMLVEWMLMLPVAIIFTWFYNRTKGSILVTALLHPAVNTSVRFLPITLGGVVVLVAITVFAILRDRMWRRPSSDENCRASQ